MTRTLKELQDQCIKLGLPLQQSGRRKSKQDCLKVLREFYLKRDFPTNGQLPYQEVSPMLCFDFWKLRPLEQLSIWKDGNLWLIQPKVNGCRAICHFVKGLGVYVQSRNLSSETFRRSDLTQHLLFYEMVPDFSACIDTEVICESMVDTRPYTSKGVITRETLSATTALLQLTPIEARKLQFEQGAPLKFKCFDLLSWQGNDLRKKKLAERLPYLSDFMEAIKGTDAGRFFEPLIHQLHSKKLFFERLLEQKFEGAVLKHLDSTYQDNSSRNRKGWIKIKRSVQLTGTVSGFEAGKPSGRWANKVACLCFAINTTEGPHLLAKVTSIPRKLRNSATVKKPGSAGIMLHPDLYGRTALLKGSELTAKSLRLSHPQVLKWNPPGTKDEMIYSMDSIRSGQLLLPIVKDQEKPNASA
jgi:hypothetical protein